MSFWRRIRLVVKQTQLRAYRQIIGLMLLALLGLITTSRVPTLSAQQVEVTAQTITQTSNAQLLLQQGIELYEAQQFSEAAAVWERAASTFSEKIDTITHSPQFDVSHEHENRYNLRRALVLSNLSSAYQELGQWEEAEAAIAKSLNLLQNMEDLANSQTYLEILAKALNTQGSLEWAKGKLESALLTWKRATATYAKAGNQTGIIGSSINKAKALQALGLSRQAQETLEQVNQILQQSDPPFKATGLRHFGNALRRVGRLDESRQVLVESLQLPQQPTAKGSALLELGNTEQALSNRAIAIGKEEEAIEHTQAAIKFYQQASDLGKQLQSQLNQLSLLVEIGQWSEAGKLWPKIQRSMTNLSPSRATIYSQINFAQSLTCLKQIVDKNDFSCISRDRQEQLIAPRLFIETPSWQEIAQILATAVQQAQSLQDLKAKSYALGQMGGLYEVTQQWSEAQNLTQQALLLLEEIQAPDLRYRWEWQLGRLFEKQNDLKGAIAAYTAAVETLKSVRSDLLTINPDVQFSFRDKVEPVYRGLVNLLLKTEGNQASQENLERAIANIDSLQLAELENFLGCNLGQTEQLNQNLDKVERQAAFIHPIILKDRLEVIFKLPGQPLRRYGHPIQQTVIEKTLKELRRAILGRNAGTVREKSQDVYKWLIEPLESQLEKSSEVETLVFVLDGDLRNVPMGVLYDGKANKYLIEKKYALAIVPSSQLLDLRVKPERLQVLGAGISVPLEVENRKFDALNATEELRQIEKTVSTKLLLDSQFTLPNLQQNLKSGDFSVVHLATHGNFSSNPEETFLLAYGEILKSNDLDNLLQSADQEAAGTIELLVLSACQTAEGDNRATLGLAGLAIRSGARSTLATLWQVSDESSVNLIGQFYKELNQPRVSKAQALHHAQQALLKEPKYQNPYYWAPYVLVGNWL